MRHRFEQGRRNPSQRNILISLLLFFAVFSVFFAGVSSLSGRTDEEELRTLENAVARGITHCYAIEGNYPESLAYLEENYGLRYDKDKFFIGYQPTGPNLLPDVTIIRKGDSP